MATNCRRSYKCGRTRPFTSKISNAWLVSPEVKTFETCSNPVIVTRASLLKSFTCGKRTFSKVKLSITLHGLTRSRKIIDICKKLGLGISYSNVLQLHSAWTKYEEEQDNVMDNDDFQDDTLTGSNTTHHINVMFVQPKAFRNVEEKSCTCKEEIYRGNS